MRIVCPACETGYQVADGTLGVTGRKVRCARCGTVWHATPNDYPEAPMAVVPVPQPPGGGPEPSEDDWRDAIVGDGPGSGFAEGASPDEASGENDQSAIDDLFASGPADDASPADVDSEETAGGNDQSAVDDLFAAESAGDKVVKAADDAPSAMDAETSPTIDAPPSGFENRRRKPRGKTGRRGTSAIVMIDRHLQTPVASALLISFLVLFCVVAVVGRERIVATFPDFAGIYELLGLKVNLRGLDFQNVAARQEMDGSTPVLVVEGDIVNLDSESKGLPAIRITLKSTTGRDVYGWNYALPQLNVDQMGKVHFKTRLLAPPEASVTVEVRFTDQHQP